MNFKPHILKHRHEERKQFSEQLDKARELQQAISRKRQNTERPLAIEAEELQHLGNILRIAELNGAKNQTFRQSIQELEDRNKKLEAEIKEYSGYMEASQGELESLILQLEHISRGRAKRTAIRQLLTTIIISVVLLTLSWVAQHYNPNLGKNVSSNYYSTIATIAPIFYVAAFVEAGIYRKEYISEITRISDAVTLSVPAYLIEIFSLPVLTSLFKSSTFILTATYMLSIYLLVNSILTSYLTGLEIAANKQIRQHRETT